LANNSKRLNSNRFLIMGVLLLICVGMEYYFHFILGIHVVYTHLFYIPIVLAALWWGLKGGLFMSLFLAFLHIGTHFPSIDEAYVYVLSRSLVFVIVGTVIGVASDKRKQAEVMAELAHKELNQIFQIAAGGMRVIDKNFNTLRVNETFLNLSGVNKDEAVSKKCYEVFPGPLCHASDCPLSRILGGEERVEYDVEKERNDGTKVSCIVTATPFYGLDGKLVGIVEDFKDITERKQAEEHIKHLNRVLSVTGDINQLIVKENDSKELLRKSCKILVQSRDYGIAQAVLTKKNKPVFQAVAVQPEFEDKELEMMFSTEKIMPCAYKALKEQISVIVSEGGMESFCSDCLLSKRYAHGFSISIPLSYQGETFGALTVYSNLPHAFDKDEVRFLGEVCEDISFALESMEKEERRKRAEVKLENRVIELTTLSEVSANISSTLEIDRVLELSLGSARQLLDAECGSIMLLDEKEKLLTVTASSGLSKEFAETKEKLGEGIAGHVAKTGKPLFLKKDMKDTQFEKYRKERKIKDALSIPIRTKDKIIGAFNVDNKRQGTFTQSDLRFFTILASEVGAAIENARLYQDIKQGLLNTVKALAMAVDAKDPYTHGHSERVVKYSLAIANEMNLPKEEIEEIEISARLHDVGKIGVSGKILGKLTSLTEKEWNVIKKHPKTSVKILEPVDFSFSIVSCVLSHHERPDGKGYPNGISKNEIPLGASIIKVADAFDAMTSDRPYRKALSEKKAISELKKHSGTQFHPEVVEAFLRVCKGATVLIVKI